MKIVWITTFISIVALTARAEKDLRHHDEEYIKDSTMYR